MPKTPIYVSMLAETGQAVIGQPHPTGRPALRMLEHEGFVYERYLDIFDGGPTVVARTDDIRTVREARTETVAEIGDGGPLSMLAAAGQLKNFRCCCASIAKVGRKGVKIDPQAARLLEVGVGDEIVMVGR